MPFSRREFVAGILTAAGVRAQDANSVTTIKTDVKVVNILATVRDKRGAIVKFSIGRLRD